MASNPNPNAPAGPAPGAAPGAAPAPSGQEAAPPMPVSSSQAVLAVKIIAAVLGVMILVWYIFALAYPDSPFYLIGIIFGVIGLVMGIAGVFMGKITISKKKNVPTLNVLLIILSIIFLFMMAILGSWEDESTFGKNIWNVYNMVFVLVFSMFFVCYIELCHASLRFSEIDEYATSHNIRDFKVSAVINNYFVMFAILMLIIFLISAAVLMLQIPLSGWIKDIAPSFGNSAEYNSIFSVVISIGLIFVPIGIILTFVFGFFFKSRRKIVVKSKEDVVARAPEAVKMD